MTPDPNSKAFIRNEIPEDAVDDVLKYKEIYDLLRANASACVWPYINENNLSLVYNTYTGKVEIEIKFTDENKHTHRFFLKTDKYRDYVATCEYLFEGGIEAPVTTFRSYAEWLMVQLWDYDYNSYLCHCDRGINFEQPLDKGYKAISTVLDIVTNNIKPIEWFLSDEPVWQFHTTYCDLSVILPLLQEEATKGRWKDVKPGNFWLACNKDSALICLDYLENGKYAMRFHLGMTKDGFAAEATDKFIDMYYRFDVYASNNYLREYYLQQNREFVKIANLILDIPFQWHALFAHGDEGFYINTYREYAFQKYCLMLDCIIPLKDNFEATERFIAPELLEKKKNFEDAVSMEFDIVEENGPNLIFTHGKYVPGTWELVYGY